MHAEQTFFQIEQSYFTFSEEKKFKKVYES